MAKKNKTKMTPFREDVRAEQIFRQLHLERVLVIPVWRKKDTMGKHKSRGVFVLVFGYGEFVDKDFDLIVIWSEAKDKKTFDDLPFKIPFVRAEGRSKLFPAKFKEIENRAKACVNKMRVAKRGQRRPLETSTESIMRALRDGKGFWGDVPQGARDSSLRKKHLKKPVLQLLSLGEPVPINWFLDQMPCHFLLLRDVFNDEYSLDSKITPDPYSVVRHFLRFIGVYPEKRGGQQKQ